MKVADYYRYVLVPANSAVSALRRAGIPVSLERIRAQRAAWAIELKELERYVEGEAASRGFTLKYSDKHAIDTEVLAEFLTRGMGFELGQTANNNPSTADEYLSKYASLSVPWETDDPVVKAVLQIRSLAKATSTYLNAFERTRRADGCCHCKFNWALRTARISAEDPPMHQIPERADPRVADAIKACFVPRMNPARSVEEWDPRIHGSVFRWDIAGAEAAIRAGMFAKLSCERTKQLRAYDYIRLGKDLHSLTASFIYEVPEGTYKKGSYERDAVGKTSFFLNLFGGGWRALQAGAWNKGRLALDDDMAKKIIKALATGYPELPELYEMDKRTLGERGYAEDAYGRRRRVDWKFNAPNARYRDGEWDDSKCEDFEKAALQNCFHIMANTPTQSTNATDNLFMLSMAYHGEYLELKVPPMWERDGVPFPEAREWALHEGPGPGGRPMLAWHSNTVHDSGWGDCAPDYLEPTAKLIWRRCRALPLDMRIAADMPYRIDLSVGPDMANLYSYNKVAKRFGLEPVSDK